MIPIDATFFGIATALVKTDIENILIAEAPGSFLVKVS